MAQNGPFGAPLVDPSESPGQNYVGPFLRFFLSEQMRHNIGGFGRGSKNMLEKYVFYLFLNVAPYGCPFRMLHLLNSKRLMDKKTPKMHKISQTVREVDSIERSVVRTDPESCCWRASSRRWDVATLLKFNLLVNALIDVDFVVLFGVLPWSRSGHVDREDVINSVEDEDVGPQWARLGPCST